MGLRTNLLVAMDLRGKTGTVKNIGPVDLTLTKGGASGVSLAAGHKTCGAYFSSDSYFDAPTPLALQLQPPVSFFACIGLDPYGAAVGAQRPMFGVIYDSGFTIPFSSYCVWQNNGSALNLGVSGNNGASFIQRTMASASGSHTVAGVFSSSETTGYVDGVIASSSTGITSILYGATTRFRVGSLAGTSLASAVMVGYVWNRVITKSEIASLHSDPFQLLRAPQRRTRKAAAAGFKAAWLNQRSQIIGGGMR